MSILNSFNWAINRKNYQISKRIAEYLQKNAVIPERDSDGLRLLDVGCGNKPYVQLFSSVAKEYVGLECPDTPSKSAVVDVYGDASNLPFENEHFDIVVGFQVLEHVAEPNKMIAEASRVLKRRGFLALTVPFMWGIHEAPNDYYRYTKYGLRYLLEKNGFRVLILEPIAGFWFMTGLRFCYYLQRFSRMSRTLTLPLVHFVQLVSLTLDKIDFTDSDATSYYVICQKP